MKAKIVCVVLMLAALMTAAESNQAVTYPTTFYVYSEAQGNDCYMWLVDGDVAYLVKSLNYWNCRTVSAGTIAHGRYWHAGNRRTIELIYVNAKYTVERYEILQSNSIRPYTRGAK